MHQVYFNNFDKPVLDLPGGGPQGRLLGFDPKLDIAGLGRLIVADNGGATADYKFLAVAPGEDSGGTIITVTAPAPNLTHSVVSESLYAKLPAGFLQSNQTYRAQLVFDLPHAEVGKVGIGGIEPTWSVALNFKTGTTNDRFGDRRPGAACQFSGSGAVKFNSTSYNERAEPHNYSDFDPLGVIGPTQFALTVDIKEAPFDSVQGTGALTYGETVIPPHSLTDTGAIFPELALVGFALTASTGGTYSVRLRTFTLGGVPES